MMQMQQNMDKMFNRMHTRMQQRSNYLISPLGGKQISQSSQFVDKGKNYAFITNIPENKENQVDITAKDGTMSINAKIIEKKENKTANSYSSSSSMRMYQQTIPLPADAKESSLKAAYKDGKLVITIDKDPNAQKATPNIQIHTSTNKPAKQTTTQQNEVNQTLTNQVNSVKTDTNKSKEQNNTVDKNITINTPTNTTI